LAPCLGLALKWPMRAAAAIASTGSSSTSAGLLRECGQGSRAGLGRRRLTYGPLTQ
jgi:hypothetical protein